MAELDALQFNLVIDANVFRACRESGVSKIVRASSVSVYPADRQQALGAVFKEDDFYPINPEGGYGWAKLMGEIQLGMMEDCKCVIARIFNAYGEHCEYERTAQVVPALTRTAINYPKEDFVWGDGKQTRNLIHIGDCVDALLKMEESATYPPLILNIGNEKTTTIKELAETIVKVSGKSVPVRYVETCRTCQQSSRYQQGRERFGLAANYKPNQRTSEDIQMDWVSMFLCWQWG